MAKIDDKLINACQNLVKELNRVEAEKEKKREEERLASEQREARRNYWAKKLYSDYSQPMTLIIPEDSKFKK